MYHCYQVIHKEAFLQRLRQQLRNLLFLPTEKGEYQAVPFSQSLDELQEQLQSEVCDQQRELFESYVFFHLSQLGKLYPPSLTGNRPTLYLDLENMDVTRFRQEFHFTQNISLRFCTEKALCQFLNLLEHWKANGCHIRCLELDFAVVCIKKDLRIELAKKFPTLACLRLIDRTNNGCDLSFVGSLAPKRLFLRHFYDAVLSEKSSLALSVKTLVVESPRKNKQDRFVIEGLKNIRYLRFQKQSLKTVEIKGYFPSLEKIFFDHCEPDLTIKPSYAKSSWKREQKSIPYFYRLFWHNSFLRVHSRQEKKERQLKKRRRGKR